MNYTVPEVASELRLDEETVRRMLRKGKMKGFKAAKRWLVKEEDLNDYIARKANI